MLFDLRGRGRRRTVQVIYLSLAILMGGGLVLFGVGSGTDGGLLNAFNTGGTTSTNDLFKKRVEAAERAIRRRPGDAKGWESLAQLRFQEASVNYDPNAEAFTDKGKEQLTASDAAWIKALSLTDKPDPNVARQMAQAYSSTGLNKPDKAIEAFEVVLPSIKSPSAQVFVQYAALAYAAGQTRKAKLASAKALKLTKKDDREQVSAQLDAAKSQAPTGSQTVTPAADASASTG